MLDGLINNTTLFLNNVVWQSYSLKDRVFRKITKDNTDLRIGSIAKEIYRQYEGRTLLSLLNSIARDNPGDWFSNPPTSFIDMAREFDIQFIHKHAQPVMLVNATKTHTRDGCWHKNLLYVFDGGHRTIIFALMLTCGQIAQIALPCAWRNIPAEDPSRVPNWALRKPAGYWDSRRHPAVPEFFDAKALEQLNDMEREFEWSDIRILRHYGKDYYGRQKHAARSAGNKRGLG